MKAGASMQLPSFKGWGFFLKTKKNNKCHKACVEIMISDNTECDSCEKRELFSVTLVGDKIPKIY